MVSAASSRDCSGVSHKSQDGGAPAPAAAASVSFPCGFFLQNSCSAAGCAPRGTSEMASHGRLSAAMFKMAAACHVVAGGRVPADVSPSSEDLLLVRAPHALSRQLLSRQSLCSSPLCTPLADEFLANISAQRLWLPTEEDVNGAAKALMRLQDTYRLSTRDIADGNLPGGGGERRGEGAEGGEAEETPGGGGSAVEGVEWLTGAAVVDEVDVLDHLSFVAFQQGKTEEAYTLTKQLLKLDPSHERAQGNLDYFSRALSAKRKGDDEYHLLTTGIRSDSSSSSSSSSSSKRRRKDTMGGERLGEEEEEKVEVEEEVDEEEVDDGKSASYMKLCRGEGIKMVSRGGRRRTTSRLPP
ncbi:uncharacterized protein LOC144739048, partial [Lampetra planeri]